MSMIIQHNINAIKAKNKLNANVVGLKKASDKLASGYRINRAGDDAAGLAISEKMRSQIRGLNQAVRNSQDGINMIQTFEGAAQESHSVLQRMKELAVESANGTYDNPTDRAAIQLEFEQLKEELDQLADTDFNGLIMLNGGRMADNFTFLTESGTMWLTPSGIDFPEDIFINTYPKTDGLPDITMTIEPLDGIKGALTDDKELMEAFSLLNQASVRMRYVNNLPEYTLVGLSDEQLSMFSIETNGLVGIISINTSNGKVDIARVTVPQPPHNATTEATGRWTTSSVATGSYTDPEYPDGVVGKIDVSKFNQSYVSTNSQATRTEREAYMKWVYDTPTDYARLVADAVYDKDRNQISFTWSVDGQTYYLDVDENGIPQADPDMLLPVYPDDYDFANKGPQIYIKNFRFTIDDEEVRVTYDGDTPTADANFHTTRSTTSSVSTSATVKRVVDGRTINQTVTGGSFDYFTTSSNYNEYLNIWLDGGNTTITFTYNSNNDTWTRTYTDVYGVKHEKTGSWADFGLSDEVYPHTDYNERNGYCDRNLNNYFEAETGRLPNGFTLSMSLSCPVSRSTSSSGTVFDENWEHIDKTSSSSSTEINDFKLYEYDPEHPERGYVDWAVAKDGAKYTYDGVDEVWRDSKGNAVDLEKEGIYLPKSPYSSYFEPLHDGMTITVSNPEFNGDGYIQAGIRLIGIDHNVNYWGRIYDNLTYTDSVILQVGSRSKDGTEFTFYYSSGGIGNLNNDLDITALGLGIETINLNTQESANYTIDKLDYAINKVSMIRATFGAAQNRLEHKITNLTTTSENLTESESAIRDTDMAQEMMNFTKFNILQQAAQSMLSQANTQPQNILQILGQ